MTAIRVCHLYPDQLNIYADRGNIAVFRGRAERRGHALEVVGVGAGEALTPDCDLIYLGGGQDREQALIAPDLARRGDEISGAATATEPASRCPARGCCRSTPSPATGA
jgi:CobQ-like glutamine amidotransferase family enzyme